MSRDFSNDLKLRLRWEEIAPGRDFHAALVRFTNGSGGMEHAHDFWEMMSVVSGHGVHTVNGAAETLHEGDLRLIRPQDRHRIGAPPGGILLFVNVAFRAEAWADFLPAAGLIDDASAWESTAQPPGVYLKDGRREIAAEAFQRMLRAFQAQPTRLELCRFWSIVLPLFQSQDSATNSKSGPDWLSRACRAMHDPQNLVEGLPRLIALSGVSPAHLSRTLQQHHGLTPTEFVNDLRLTRAASLLATTTDEIIVIAGDCGFDNLSYFYRRFRQKYGCTPRDYQLHAQRSVAP
ncbi:MAG: Transcriptional regulator, AraC family [Capsulimonas sp.]|nr:Transcriptional regulator, AraC family [Capsulimonas sp.]